MDQDLPSLLARLEAELHHPGATASRARLDALLHPDFHEVGPDGVPRHEALRMSVWVRDGEAWRLRYHQGTAVG
ncbi:MAG: hypothetical protein WCK28_04560 [Burkholderiales bacterium]|jgi:hypothetical protein